MDAGLIVGLDGLDYEFLQEHRESFPALDSLLNANTSGRLRSTIPPATATAWTAGLSGMNPARTGVTDFDGGGGSGDDGVVTARSVEVPRVWDVVEANGGESVVIGVPVTYPATRISGAMVSGFLAPDDDDGRFHPPEMEDEIPEPYAFYLSSPGPGGRDAYLDALRASVDAKFDLVHAALDGELPGADDPSLVCFVISEIDWIQHAVRRNPPEDDYETGERIVREFLEYVDGCVGDLLERFDGPTAMLSDHGFGKYTTHHVSLNEWLARRGDLVLTENTDTRVRQALGRRVRRLLSLPGSDHLKHLAPDAIVGSVADMSTLSADDIDWGETRARFIQVFTNAGYIDMNRDRVDDIEGFAAELVEDLSSLTDPETGEPLVESAYTAGEYYRGSAVDDLPEVLFVWNDRYSGVELTGGDLVTELAVDERPPPAHAMDGFYALVGDQFDATELDMDIYDILPTLYRAMGIPLPENTDGRIQRDVFSRPISPTHETRHYTANRDFVTSRPSNSDVERRLEDLGYK